jgi:hypothetical protein
VNGPAPVSPHAKLDLGQGFRIELSMLTALAPPEVAQTNRQTWVKVDNLQIITCSGELFNHVDEGLPMWSSEGDRTVTTEIQFYSAFRYPPAITLGVTGLDSSHDQNLRFWLNAIDVTGTGFIIEFKTWGDTHIARASVSWQAVGAKKPTIKTGSNL